MSEFLLFLLSCLSPNSRAFIPCSFVLVKGIWFWPQLDKVVQPELSVMIVSYPRVTHKFSNDTWPWFGQQISGAWCDELNGPTQIGGETWLVLKIRGQARLPFETPLCSWKMARSIRLQLCCLVVPIWNLRLWNLLGSPSLVTSRWGVTTLNIDVSAAPCQDKALLARTPSIRKDAGLGKHILAKHPFRSRKRGGLQDSVSDIISIFVLHCCSLIRINNVNPHISPWLGSTT
jgi:hypothetical protein